MVLVYLILLGLCLGSFVNALVWRIHKQEQTVRKSKTKNREYSIAHGRSMCVHCHQTLAWYDLVPIFSWLSLRGRCRYCHKAISWQYPTVELLTAALFAVSYIFWPYGLAAIGVVKLAVWLFGLVLLMALAVYDLRWMLLPDRLVFTLIYIQLAAVFVYAAMGGGLESLGTAGLGFLFIGGLFYALFQISGGRWIGGGDVKLGFYIGLLVGGPVMALLVVFLASVIGTLIALPLMATGRVGLANKIPFGPMLIAATFVVYIFGQRIVDYGGSLLLLQ